MNKKEKSKYIGVMGTVIVHVALIALLIFVSFTVPQPQETSGVAVMMGDVPAAKGLSDPSLVDVDVLPQEDNVEPNEISIAKKIESAPKSSSERKLITQTLEETVDLKSKAENKKIPKSKRVIKVPAKSTAEIEAEARALTEKKAMEAKKRATDEAIRKQKKAEAAARSLVKGSFGKGEKMGVSKGESAIGTGIEGDTRGNSSTGKSSGAGGYGTFDLGGRSIGFGGLPRPVYRVQEEGRVVVTIIVNPSGKVISVNINRKTNTVSLALRSAAMEAAKKAVFNKVSEVNNQTGTITYFFKLK
ncbi:MAG: cell envelope integrity protein TolA [Bacteroidaceae bacterium]